VGKQITDSVYLSLDQSVSGDGGTSATVQYDVTSNLKIEADVGGDKNTGVGFAWVKKY
jgi:autotransporter translocation and assembly factor TamB